MRRSELDWLAVFFSDGSLCTVTIGPKTLAQILLEYFAGATVIWLCPADPRARQL